MNTKERFDLVTTELKGALWEEEAAGSYSEVLLACLRSEGKLLSDAPRSQWPLLTLACCESASAGRWRHATPAAAALEVLIVALDILDDLEDGDDRKFIDRFGLAQVLNGTTGLLVLAQRLLFRLGQHGVSPAKVLQVSQILNRQLWHACSGQHLDLAFESREDVALAEALAMTGKKSASLTQAACEVGAALGTDDAASIALYASFGWHLGMAAQLLNDLHDAWPDAEGKSDIEKQKKTVPITFGLTQPDTSVLLLKSALKQAPTDISSQHLARQLLCNSGAIHYAWTMAEIQRQQALEVLDQIQTLGSPVEVLRSLLP